MAVTEDITGRLQKARWTWTCTSAGAYSEATTKQYNGRIVELMTDPTDGPTDNYDITLLDSNSVDVLAGQGADRHTTTTQYKLMEDKLGFVKSSALTLTIASAGDVKSGVVEVYIQDMDKGVVG